MSATITPLIKLGEWWNLADTSVLGTDFARSAGSSPVSPTNNVAQDVAMKKKCCIKCCVQLLMLQVKSRLEDLLVLGSPKRTRKATILEDKFVAQDVAFDKKCCS